MSGPKDFTFVFDAIRTEMMRRAAMERQQARARALAAQLEECRQRTAERLAQMRAAAASRNEAVSEHRREEASRKRADAMRQASSTGNAQSQPATPEFEREIAEEQTPTLAASQRAAAEEKYQELVGWRQSLEADQDTQTFGKNVYAEWAARADALITQAETHGIDNLLDQLNEHIATASQLHQQAGDTASRFETRNLLLRDVIDSMKSIGFFVEDPYFESPADPAGAVILKATKGDENISATIDLSNTIRSIWNGIENEACKETFFDYVDEMQSRGIKVQALRDDLQEGRPILKQQGVKDLPHSNRREVP